MSENLKSIIAARVRAARRGAGLTQAQLAEAVNTVEAISNIERAKSLPPLDLLEAIALATGTSIATLVAEPEGDGPVRERAALESGLLSAARTLPIERLRLAASLIQVLRDARD